MHACCDKKVHACCYKRYMLVVIKKVHACCYKKYMLVVSIHYILFVMCPRGNFLSGKGKRDFRFNRSRVCCFCTVLGFHSDWQ